MHICAKVFHLQKRQKYITKGVICLRRVSWSTSLRFPYWLQSLMNCRWRHTVLSCSSPGDRRYDQQLARQGDQWKQRLHDRMKWLGKNNTAQERDPFRFQISCSFRNHGDSKASGVQAKFNTFHLPPPVKITVVMGEISPRKNQPMIEPLVYGWAVASAGSSHIKFRWKSTSANFKVFRHTSGDWTNELMVNYISESRCFVYAVGHTLPSPRRPPSNPADRLGKGVKGALAVYADVKGKKVKKSKKK